MYELIAVNEKHDRQLQPLNYEHKQILKKFGLVNRMNVDYLPNTGKWYKRTKLEDTVRKVGSDLTHQIVKWELITKPIVFSKDVTLKCYNSQENTCRSGGRKWKAGSNSALLIFDEGPVNKTKYGSECMEDGFTLTIKHFDLEDFNQYYACSYGFEKYGANLSTDNYEFHPMTNTFNISNIVNGTIDSIDVSFLKVYPFPQCFLLDKDVLIKPQKVFQNFASYFYRGNITFEYKLMEEGCGQNLSIVCHDASNNSIQLPYNTLLKQCLESKKEIGSKKEKSIAVVVLCISVPLVLVGGFLFFLYKKIRRNPKKDKQRQGKAELVKML
ncbi:uncharacterized protein [Mytilus edulis]|uniref:uncharacterized protein n=1 Tax=Mytilus edulis TaxID=6550 RepID=UPI0039EEF835